MWLPRLCCTADLYRDEADVWYSSRIQLEIDYEPVSYTHLTLPTTPYV